MQIEMCGSYSIESLQTSLAHKDTMFILYEK